jgi:hypothetical protein
MPLKFSTPDQEGTLHISKSRKLPVLMSASEMRALLSELEPFFIFTVGKPIEVEGAELSKEQFLTDYERYIQGIQAGELIEETSPIFSSVFTTTKDALYAMPLQNGKVLIKSRIPVVQLQRHHFIYSDTFHSGVVGRESITWGIQFSYPQLYMDPKTRAIGKVDKSDSFPNSPLFQRLAKWMRDHTRATPFLIGEVKNNQPMRLGKESFSWIRKHPGLKEKGLDVEVKSDS